MVIWKDGMPYIVKEVDDLKDIIEDDVLEQIKKFINEYVDNSQEVDELNSKIDELESVVYGMEDETGELEEALEELKEKHSSYRDVITNIKDFMDVMEVKILNKDQAYYYDKMREAMSQI